MTLPEMLSKVVSTGNNYIIQVKGNQKSLFKQLKINMFDEKRCVSSFTEETQARERLEVRKTFIYKDLFATLPAICNNNKKEALSGL